MSKFLKLVAEQLITPPTSGLDRGSMPQIKDLDGFEKFVNSKGIETKTITVPALQLIGSQSNLDMEKVSDIAKNKKYGKLLVTSDMQVVDGHHRWAAAFNNGDSLSALMVNLTIPELLNFASEFSGTKYASESILEMAYPEGFNLSDLKNIRSFKGKLEYVRSKLGKHLGKGSSRIVFPVDNDKVLKLAWNRRGIAQNEAEALSSRTHNITAEVFDYAEDYSWIEMEKTTPLKSSSQLKAKTGLDSEELRTVLRKQHYDVTGKKPYWYVQDSPPDKYKEWDDIWEDEFVYDLIGFLVDYGLLDRDFSSEFSQPKHFGVNSKGEIKLIDYGLNKSVFDEYYNKFKLKERYSPPAEYRFWISPDGDVVDVGSTSHEEYMGIIRDNDPTEADKEMNRIINSGWIRVTGDNYVIFIVAPPWNKKIARRVFDFLKEYVGLSKKTRISIQNTQMEIESGPMLEVLAGDLFKGVR